MRFTHEPGIEVRGNHRRRLKGRSFLASTPETTTKVVCKKCNGGWMSDLETKASTLLSPMIEGEDYLLSTDDQVFMAEWTMKTVMMWQTINPEAQVIPPSDYNDFCESQKPPPLTKILLGHYSGTKFSFAGYTQEHLFRGEVIEPTPPDGYRSILVVGCLVFEVIGSCDDEFFAPKFPELVGETLLQIWPSPQSTSWPPLIALEDEGMLRFLDPPPGIIP
jgi:hypothetical protein